MGISSSVVAGSAWIIGGVLPFGRDTYAVPVKNVSWNSLYRGVPSLAALNRDTGFSWIRSQRLGANFQGFGGSPQYPIDLNRDRSEHSPAWTGGI